MGDAHCSGCGRCRRGGACPSRRSDMARWERRADIRQRHTDRRREGQAPPLRQRLRPHAPRVTPPPRVAAAPTARPRLPRSVGSAPIETRTIQRPSSMRRRQVGRAGAVDPLGPAARVRVERLAREPRRLVADADRLQRHRAPAPASPASAAPARPASCALARSRRSRACKPATPSLADAGTTASAPGTAGRAGCPSRAGSSPAPSAASAGSSGWCDITRTRCCGSRT